MTDYDYWEFDTYCGSSSNDTYLRWITPNHSNDLGAKVNITFSNGDTEWLIRKCPSNCPMKRGDDCLSSKCIREYPKKG